MAAEEEDRRVRTSSTRATFSALGFSIASSSSISIAAYGDERPRMLEGFASSGGPLPFQRLSRRTGCLRRPAIGLGSGYYAEAASSSSAIFRRLGSTRTPGPMVDETVTART